MESATAPTLKSSPHIITFLLVWSFEKQPGRTPLCRYDTAECHVPVAAEGGGKLYTRQECMLLSKGRRILLTKMEIILKNNFAFSNVAVRFSETFVCLTCKQHEIKRGGITSYLAFVHI
jgi:hypothetical protein